MYTLKIKVTKEILKKSAMCGFKNGKFSSEENKNIGANCALSLAVRDIFPNAWVGRDFLCTDSDLFFRMSEERKETGVNKFTSAMEEHPSKFMFISREMTRFIEHFNLFSPEERKGMQEEEFDLPIPDAVIDAIDIEEVKKVLENSPVLSLEEV